MNKKDIYEMLWEITGFSAKESSDLEAREIDIHTSTSYSDEQYRVWFFHIAGSPVKMVGVVTRCGLGFKMSFSYNGDKFRTFYFNADFSKTTFNKLQYGTN